VNSQLTHATRAGDGWRGVEPWRQVTAVLGAAALLGLVSLTWVIVTTGHLGAWDARIRASLAAVPPWLLSIAGAVSQTASPWVAYPLLAVVGVTVATRRRQIRPLVLTTVAAAALGLSVYFGKLIIGRPRPRLGHLPASPVPSYPSGHATTSVVVVGCIFILVAGSWSTRQRGTALAGYVAYAGLVGVSRVILGVHWFSDVMAGWLLGTFIVASLSLGYSRSIARGTVEGQLLEDRA
jgi:membrane-associated phospholipid phosphatase